MRGQLAMKVEICIIIFSPVLLVAGALVAGAAIASR